MYYYLIIERDTIHKCLFLDLVFYKKYSQGIIVIISYAINFKLLIDLFLSVEFNDKFALKI